MLFVLLGCLAAAPLITQPAASCPESPSLQFMTIIRARGCPLTLYFPTDSSTGVAYLGPAFCVSQNAESIMRSATHMIDLKLNASFISIPITVTDSGLLAEAQVTLRPVLQGRKLQFLKILSAQQLDLSLMPLTMTETGEKTAFITLKCAKLDCLDLLSKIRTNSFENALEKIKLNVKVLLPGSYPISLSARAYKAHQNRDLSPLTSPSVRPAPGCTNLEHQVTLTIDGNCSVTVLRRTDRKGHFLIEPIQCPSAEGREYFTEENSYLIKRRTFILDMRSDRIKNMVKTNLSNLEPLSVTFLSVVQAEVQVSRLSYGQSFESFKLTADGDRTEVSFASRLSSRLDLSLRNLIEIWRQLSFTIESQLDKDTPLCSWWSQLRFATPASTGTSDLSAYHSIDNGFLCIKHEFKLHYPALKTAEACAIVRKITSQCEAFSIVSGYCQLFVFDKCSRMLVTDIRCNRRGRVFIRNQPGLEPGQLCPVDYGGSYYGMKYKVFKQSGAWLAAKSACELENGLVTLSDLVAPNETAHAYRLKDRYETASMWIGGYRTPGNLDPKVGWKWTGCNSDVNTNLWRPGQPDNFGNSEDATEIGMGGKTEFMNDVSKHSIADGFLCKCVSPF